VIGAAARAAQACNVFLAVGTSLSVHSAAGLTDLAADAGARVVVVNAEPTPYDDLADPAQGPAPRSLRSSLAGARCDAHSLSPGLVVREPIGTALPRLLAG